MKLLVIEDDQNKRHQMVSLLSEQFPEAEIEIAQALQSGLRKVIAGAFDLILLDMTLPTYDPSPDEDGGQLKHYAGREILSQMDRRNIVMPVLVVTQFDKFGEEPDKLTLGELDVQLRQSHAGNYRGSIFYDLSTERWKAALVKRVGELARITNVKNPNS
jgi:CheY-like chemotaxis protein